MRKSSFWAVLVATLVGILVLLNLYQYAWLRIESERARSLERRAENQATLLQRFRRYFSAQRVGNPTPLQQDEQQIVDRFHQVFYDRVTTWGQNRWMGIPTQQNPNDVWITQEIIWEVKPDFVIEMGTFKGGSAVLWATILEQVNPHGRVITVDIEDQASEARAIPIAQSKIDFLIGSSTSPRIVGEIKRRAQNGKVLLILDSDHSKAHVLRELQLYAPFIAANSYIIVQDSNVNGHPVYPEHGPGPAEAIEDFLKTHPEFIQDRTRERLLLTMHPGGYLKRVG